MVGEGWQARAALSMMYPFLLLRAALARTNRANYRASRCVSADVLGGFGGEGVNLPATQEGPGGEGVTLLPRQDGSGVRG